jgi:hypothetical protein
MFAAAEAHYVDRRLVGNMLQSYFDGPKAGSDEVLSPYLSKLDSSIHQTVQRQRCALSFV